MSDVDARLAQADPFRGQTYEHPDLEGMITRVTRVTTRPAPGRVWRGFQLRVAGALAASVLLTVGAIATIEGAGSGLSVLTLSATDFSPAVTPTQFEAGTQLGATSSSTFVATPSLSSTTPSTLSYQLATPASPSKETARLASIFKVVGTPMKNGADPVQWTVKDTRGDELTYSNVGVPLWSYSGGAKLVSGALPSRVTIERDAQRYATELGYGYVLAAPSVTTEQISSGANAVATPELAVSYSVNVAHLATGQTLSLVVNARNQVVQAAGPAFAVATAVAYPLQSPRSASRDVVRAKASSAALGSAAHSTASSTVSLTRSSLSLRAYRVSDGKLWLLPVYTFQGVTKTGARALGRSLLVIALQPRYVAIRPGSSVTTSSVLNP